MVFLPACPKKEQTAAHILCVFVFCLYLSGVLTVTGIGRPFSFRPRFNFLPFVDMVKGPVDTALNVILFLPLGVFLPLLYTEFETIKRVAAAAFCLSIAIELIQMFGLGITDINDLMTNTAGARLGFALSRKRRARLLPDRKKKLQAANVSGFFETVLLAASVFVSALVFVGAWC